MEYLSVEGREKLRQVIGLIVNTLNVTRSVFAQYGDSDYEEEPFLFTKYAERFTFNLKSINVLLKEYELDPNFETSIGLLIRPSLLDFLVLTYLISFKADIESETDEVNDEKYQQVLSIFLCDHMHHAFDFIGHLRDVGWIDKPGFIAIVDNLMRDYAPLFSDSTPDYSKPGNKLIAAKKMPSLPTLFKRLAQHPVVKSMALAYDQYTYFSKYEHFGIMTAYLQAREVDTDLYNMLEGIKYIHKGLYIAISCIPDGASKHKEELGEILSISHGIEKIINDRKIIQT